MYVYQGRKKLPDETASFNLMYVNDTLFMCYIVNSTVCKCYLVNSNVCKCTASTKYEGARYHGGLKKCKHEMIGYNMNILC